LSESPVIRNEEKPIGGFAPKLAVELPQQEIQSASVRLQEIFNRDEQYRAKLDPNRLASAKSDPEQKRKLLDEMRLSDRINRLQVQAMLDKGELTTDSDFNTAAIIFQHGESTVDCKHAFELSLKAINAGQPTRAALTPATFDRFMIYAQLNQGIPLDQVRQRFNTQTLPDASGDQYRPLLDGQATPDELRLFGIQPPDTQAPAEQRNIDQPAVLVSLRDKLDTYKLSA